MRLGHLLGYSTMADSSASQQLLFNICWTQRILQLWTCMAMTLAPNSWLPCVTRYINGPC